MDELQVRLDLLILKLSLEFREGKPLSKQSFVQTYRTLKLLRSELKPSSLPKVDFVSDYLRKVAKALESHDPVLKRLGSLSVNSLDTLLNTDHLLRNFTDPGVHEKIIAWRDTLLKHSQTTLTETNIGEQQQQQQQLSETHCPAPIPTLFDHSQKKRCRYRHERRGDVLLRRL